MVVAYTLLAGMAMPLGAGFASIERIRPRWLENELRHGVVAFGGGALELLAARAGMGGAKSKGRRGKAKTAKATPKAPKAKKAARASA